MDAIIFSQSKFDSADSQSQETFVSALSAQNSQSSLASAVNCDSTTIAGCDYQPPTYLEELDRERKLFSLEENVVSCSEGNHEAEEDTSCSLKSQQIHYEEQRTFFSDAGESLPNESTDCCDHVIPASLFSDRDNKQASPGAPETSLETAGDEHGEVNAQQQNGVLNVAKCRSNEAGSDSRQYMLLVNCTPPPDLPSSPQCNSAPALVPTDTVANSRSVKYVSDSEDDSNDISKYASSWHVTNEAQLSLPLTTDCLARRGNCYSSHETPSSRVSPAHETSEGNSCIAAARKMNNSPGVESYEKLIGEDFIAQQSGTQNIECRNYTVTAAKISNSSGNEEATHIPNDKSTDNSSCDETVKHGSVVNVVAVAERPISPSSGEICRNTSRDIHTLHNSPDTQANFPIDSHTVHENTISNASKMDRLMSDCHIENRESPLIDGITNDDHSVSEKRSESTLTAPESKSKSPSESKRQICEFSRLTCLHCSRLLFPVLCGHTSTGTQCDIQAATAIKSVDIAVQCDIASVAGEKLRCAGVQCGVDQWRVGYLEDASVQCDDDIVTSGRYCSNTLGTQYGEMVNYCATDPLAPTEPVAVQPADSGTKKTRSIRFRECCDADMKPHGETTQNNRGCTQGQPDEKSDDAKKSTNDCVLGQIVDVPVSTSQMKRKRTFKCSVIDSLPLRVRCNVPADTSATSNTPDNTIADSISVASASRHIIAARPSNIHHSQTVVRASESAHMTRLQDDQIKEQCKNTDVLRDGGRIISDRACSVSRDARVSQCVSPVAADDICSSQSIVITRKTSLYALPATQHNGASLNTTSSSHQSWTSDVTSMPSVDWSWRVNNWLTVSGARAKHSAPLSSSDHACSNNVYWYSSRSSEKSQRRCQRSNDRLLFPRSKRRSRRPRLNYSCEEVDNLIAGVKKFGWNFKRILLGYDFHRRRTAVDLYDKYRHMIKQH